MIKRGQGKICSKCKKPSEFHIDRSKKDGLHTICKKCFQAIRLAKRARDPEFVRRCRERSRLYRKNNPLQYKLAIANATLKAKYNITLKEYGTMLADQKGVCKVCSSPPGKQRLHVDHDHVTGVVRGLLCQACNVSIGKMKESPALIRKLAAYVEVSSSRSYC